MIQKTGTSKLKSQAEVWHPAYIANTSIPMDKGRYAFWISFFFLHIFCNCFHLCLKCIFKLISYGLNTIWLKLIPQTEVWPPPTFLPCQHQLAAAGII